MSHDHHAMIATTPMDHSMHNMTTVMNNAHQHPVGNPDHNHDSGLGSDQLHNNHEGSMEHSMKMYFHTGLSEYILFESILTSSTGGIVAACFAMFALAISYEGLKFFREYLLRKAALHQTYSPSTTDQVFTKQPALGTRMLSGMHGLQTLLHMVQVFISYCLMLVFMTYNVWLCLAIILGAGLGYFLFGWRRAMVVDVNEHCH